jgi:SAM-dependent methyltransferase
MKTVQRLSRLKKLFLSLEQYLQQDEVLNHDRENEFNQIRRLIEYGNVSESGAELDYLFLRISDLSKLLMQDKRVNWRIETNKPVAIDSDDHIHPRGVKQDETRKPAFVKQIIDIYGPDTSYLDLGCAGGGLVFDFIINDCKAIGIEGSDYSRNHARAYWNEIPWALHTADLTSPIKIYLENQPATFDVIGAWEFFEHIEEKDLESVFSNIRNHFKDDRSLFLANIATFEDSHNGTHWHKTIKPKEWWVQRFLDFDFEVIQYPFSSEFNPRGSGNTFGTWGNDYDIQSDPGMGFAIAARLK